MEEKPFQQWHILKAQLHRKENVIYFHEREIWFCSLGVNVGFEQDGKNEWFERPILILRKFNNFIFWAIPLSSTQKIGVYYHAYQLYGRSYTAILSQLRLLDVRRLSRKVGTIPKGDFDQIIEKIKYLFDKKRPHPQDANEVSEAEAIL